MAWGPFLLNENNWILIKIPLRFVSNGSFDDMPTLFGHRSRQLSEPVMSSKLHICVIRPPSVKWCSEKCETYISMNNMMIHFHIFVTTIQGHLFYLFFRIKTERKTVLNYGTQRDGITITISPYLWNRCLNWDFFALYDLNKWLWINARSCVYDAFSYFSLLIYF